MIALVVALAAVAGIAFGLQGPLNAALADKLHSPMAAGVVSFGVGFASLVIAYVVFGALGLGGAGAGGASWRALGDLDWRLWLGGLLGAVGVVGLLPVIPRLGAANAISILIAGQLVSALVVDRLGWFGIEPAPLSARRLAGAALLVFSTWLLRR